MAGRRWWHTRSRTTEFTGGFRRWGGSKSTEAGRTTSYSSPPGSLPCVVIDDNEADDARRYKMLYYPHNVSFSPDGVSWSDVENLRVPSRSIPDGLNCLAGWDADIGRYAAYFRPQIARPGEETRSGRYRDSIDCPQ